jgi:predicted enzyme related to lactoylglutathione lyase
MPNRHHAVDYVEFPARDPAATRAFFEAAFGWTFTDYGPDYTSFSDQGVDGGFFRAPLTATPASGSALIVLYSEDLEASEAAVTAAGGVIVQATFPFPGGRRFHFTCPSGNEYAVWSS